MEKSSDSIRLAHKLKIFLRNIVFLLNAILWLFVLIFIHDDEIVAFLFDVSSTLTVLTMKYYLWGVTCNSKNVVYILDCSSKILILTGISLLLLPQCWKFCFYSICTGFLMQELKCEIPVIVRDVILYLRRQVTDDDPKTDISCDAFKLHKKESEMQKSENTMKDLNEDEYCPSIWLSKKNDLLLGNATEKHNIEIISEENVESLTFHKNLNKCDPDVYETMNEEIIPSSEENLGDPEEFDKNDKSLDDNDSHWQNVSEEAVESTLENMGNCTESNVNSNWSIKEIRNIENLRVQLVNLQKLELSDNSKLESKFEFNADTFEQELERNEENDNIAEKHVALYNKDLKCSLKDGTNKLGTVDCSIESITEPGNKVKKECSHEPINIFSDPYPNKSKNFTQSIDFNGSYGSNNSLCTNQSEDKTKIKEESVHYSGLFNKEIENLHSGHSEFEMSNSILQHKENTGKINSEKVEIYLREISLENNGCSDSEAEYPRRNCRSAKITDIRSEKETSTCQMKCISERFPNKSTNVNACLQHERIDEACRTNLETNRENNLANESNLRENSFEINKNLNSEIKGSEINCTNVETTDIESKQNICQMKWISQHVNDGNLERAIGKKNDKVFVSAYSFEQKCLSNSSTISNRTSNESADVEERKDTIQSVKNASADEDTTHFQSVSNVEDVVNRIDLGFIYALGFNDPCRI